MEVKFEKCCLINSSFGNHSCSLAYLRHHKAIFFVFWANGLHQIWCQIFICLQSATNMPLNTFGETMNNTALPATAHVFFPTWTSRYYFLYCTEEKPRLRYSSVIWSITQVFSHEPAAWEIKVGWMWPFLCHHGLSW